MNVYYGIADPIVLVICRTMCDAILRKVNSDIDALSRLGALTGSR